MPPHLAYTVFMVLAALAFVVARWFVPAPPALTALPWWQRLFLLWGAFVGGTFGAKAPFALQHLAGPLAATAWGGDGKTLMAGLIGGYVGVELVKLLLGIRYKIGDTFALPLAVALAVGRWGCFCNGCCHGVETSLPWGVAFDVDGERLVCHPTQLYESAFHLGMAVLLALLLRTGVWRGHGMQVYMIAYCGFRFATEWLRPEPAWAAGLTLYQWLALGFGLALTLQWWSERRRGGSQD